MPTDLYILLENHLALSNEVHRPAIPTDMFNKRPKWKQGLSQ